MNADEFTHMLQHASRQGTEVTPFRYGHIATYDPQQHRVRCIIPSMTDQDGNPLLSPWMPMGTSSAGLGYGAQVIYAGGASATNPTAGEQVMIAVFDSRRGVAAVPCMFYHAAATPPATNLPTTNDGYNTAADQAKPGDFIVSAPPATAGAPNSFIRLRQTGEIQIWSAGALTADIIGGSTIYLNTGDADLTVAKGSVNVHALIGNISATADEGTITVQAVNGTVNLLGNAIRLAQGLASTVTALCTDNFRLLFNQHTHPNNGIPNPQATPAGTTTTVVTAE